LSVAPQNAVPVIVCIGDDTGFEIDTHTMAFGRTLRWLADFVRSNYDFAPDGKRIVALIGSGKKLSRNYRGLVGASDD
jgi:hypothetical protein